MLHRLRKRSETTKFRRLFDVCVVGRICVVGCLCCDFSHWQACIGEARHAAGQVSYFHRSNGRSNPHQTKRDPAVMSYDPKFRRLLKRTFRRTEILLLSKRKRYLRRTFRRTKTRKNLRSNQYLATEKPVKMQENSD